VLSASAFVVGVEAEKISNNSRISRISIVKAAMSKLKTRESEAIEGDQRWCVWVAEEGVEGSYCLARLDSDRKPSVPEKKAVVTLDNKVS
jgi:hypothetical protein